MGDQFGQVWTGNFGSGRGIDRRGGYDVFGGLGHIIDQTLQKANVLEESLDSCVCVPADFDIRLHKRCRRNGDNSDGGRSILIATDQDEDDDEPCNGTHPNGGDCFVAPLRDCSGCAGVVRNVPRSVLYKKPCGSLCVEGQGDAPFGRDECNQLIGLPVRQFNNTLNTSFEQCDVVELIVTFLVQGFARLDDISRLMVECNKGLAHITLTKPGTGRGNCGDCLPMILCLDEAEVLSPNLASACCPAAAFQTTTSSDLADRVFVLHYKGRVGHMGGGSTATVTVPVLQVFNTDGVVIGETTEQVLAAQPVTGAVFALDQCGIRADVCFTFIVDAIVVEEVCGCNGLTGTAGIQLVATNRRVATRQLEGRLNTPIVIDGRIVNGRERDGLGTTNGFPNRGGRGAVRGGLTIAGGRPGQFSHVQGANRMMM